MDAIKLVRFALIILFVSLKADNGLSQIMSFNGGPMGAGPGGPMMMAPRMGPMIGSAIGRGRQSPSVRTQNFIIIASDPALANEVAKAAEDQRRDLAMYWLGRELPPWSQPCPITVTAGERLGAGGATTFTPGNGTIRNWRMNVTGSQERILDSVLPHEITHTILASHFAPMNKTVPRWADEGACTTIEHGSERSKHDQFLVQFLSTGRGIPFATMFSLKEYPSDIMPLYAQGYSVTSFLIAQGGPKQFVKFLEAGMQTEDWVMATEKFYGYPMIGKLQTAWNKWVYDGGGDVTNHTADALLVSRRSSSLAASNSSNTKSVPVNESTRTETVRVASANRGSSGTSWYRQQLELNANDSDTSETSSARSSPSSHEPISPGQVIPGQVIPGQANDLNRSEIDYSVGHQQPPSSVGSNTQSNGPASGGAVNWATGPGGTIYR